MPNRSADALFGLIHTLEKSEKRAFKLYINRNSSNPDLKTVQLFDALEKMDQYDEGVLEKKLPGIKKQQLPNIKAHLYKQLLASLRLLKNEENSTIQLHEQLDYAWILYDRGLYLQSLKLLDKIKELTKAYNQDGFLIQIISLEKKIETLHITRSLQDRADTLAAEANEVHEKRLLITRLSNLALQLYSWYIKNGHARNAADEAGVRHFFAQNFPAGADCNQGFYERLYCYQSYAWYAFIRQDFLMYYRYTQKWVALFDEAPQMKSIESGHYIKGLHNLLNAHFDLRNYKGFTQALQQFEAYAATPVVQRHHNNRIQSFVYLNTAKINGHFMQGSFKQGLQMVPFIKEGLEAYGLYLDQHRILVFYYKIATLYFGSGNYNNCIDYLQKIIQLKVDLRNDLQCYARVLHLLAHYELGNTELMEHLTKSVYRFMAKMQNLTVVEEEMFQFFRRSLRMRRTEVKGEMIQLLQTIKRLERDRFETRAFAYLDIISWLESKVQNLPMEQIIQQKFLANRHR